jgi:DNA-binding SARP family transcriptional activator
VVITDNGRYRLAVPADGLDATVFERHLAAGQRHVAAGTPADAVTELDQALALWDGDVLADLADYDFVAPVATRLSDKRMAALEAKFDAELTLGRHAGVIGELDELVTRYPLNEQLQRQRMIALYRCGLPEAIAAQGGSLWVAEYRRRHGTANRHHVGPTRRAHPRRWRTGRARARRDVAVGQQRS